MNLLNRSRVVSHQNVSVSLILILVFFFFDIPEVSVSQSVHVAPTYIAVVTEQTPYTVQVAIVANFNETGVSMDIAGVYWEKNKFEYQINITCLRVSGPSPGNYNVSVCTTLGIPPPGDYTLYVREPALDQTLATENFTVEPVGILFSKDGIVASLKTYLGYTEAELELTPPGFYEYTRFWINSTSFLAKTLGIRLNNTSTDSRQNVNLTLAPPPDVNLDLAPRAWTYGNLAPGSSAVGFFNVTTTNVPLGCYNLTYTVNYTDTNGVQVIEGIIPVGIYLLKPTWIDDDTAIVYSTTPFNDNVTGIFYNYTTITTRDGYDFTTWQNFNSTFTLSNFSGSLHSPLPAVLVSALVGGGISAGTELARQLCVDKVPFKDVNWRKVAVKGVLGAATSFGVGKLVNGIANIALKKGVDIAKVAWFEAAHKSIDVGKTTIDLEFIVIEGFLTDNEVETKSVDSYNQPVDTGTTAGTGYVDAKPESSEGSNVQPVPEVPVPEPPIETLLPVALAICILFLAFRRKRKKGLNTHEKIKKGNTAPFASQHK